MKQKSLKFLEKYSLGTEEDWFRIMYKEFKYSTVKIGKLLGWSDETVRRRLNEYDISRRSFSDATYRCSLTENWEIGSEEDLLWILYKEFEYSVPKISELLNWSENATYNHLDKNNINIREDHGVTGNNNPMWGKNGEDAPNYKKIKLECKQCNEEFKVPPNRKHRKFCSEECYHQWLESNAVTGKEHPLHKEDSEDFQIWRKRLETRKKYKEWRKSVFKRDNHKCRICSSDDEIIPHHIVKMCKIWDIDKKELATDVSNGITLCVECHHLIKGCEDQLETLFGAMVESGKMSPLQPVLPAR